MKRLNFSVRSQRARFYAALALTVSAASIGCSLITKEDAAQCKSDSDCKALGFDGATCDVSAGVCMMTSSNSGGSAGTSTAGTGGNTNSAGSGGSSAGSTGIAGTSNGGTAGRGEVGGTAGSLSGGQGGEAGEPTGGTGPVCAGNCLDPVSLRLVESAKLPQYQPPGTLLGAEQFHTDVCPQDQVLTGLNLSFGTESSGSKFLLDVQAICTALSLSAATPHTIQPALGATMPKRGTDTATVNSTIVSCANGQIVTGWSGIEDTHISKFVLRCAPVTLSTAGTGVVTLSVGATTDVTPFAGYDIPGVPACVVGSTTSCALAAQDCPTGFVARGINVRLSDGMAAGPQRLERFAMACGRPSLAYKKGALCTTDGDCDSGACTGGFCAAPSCAPALGAACKCEILDTREYMFCSDTVEFSQAAGTSSGCGASNMRLVKIDDGIENGWLSSTALVRLPGDSGGAPWIGATDGAQEGKWLWVDQAQTQFWSGVNVDQGGMSVGGLYSAWKRVPNSEEPNNGAGNGNPAENCAFMDIGADGLDRWVDTVCSNPRRYECEFEDGR